MSACGACLSLDFAPFFRAGEWSTSGRYLAQPAAAGEPVDIVLECCRGCGLIRQSPSAIVRLDYVAIERGTAKQLPSYAERIIGSLSEYGVGAGDLVVEVGANDGTFLKELRNSGFRNLLGIEPSRQLAALGAQAGFDVEARYFGRELAREIVAKRGPAKAVVCRHTLEHVPDIQGLAAGIAEVLAPGGLGFVEVPDTDWVVTRLFAHEIWDEHVTYFRAGSLARLLRGVGLEPVRLVRERFRDTRNLLCWSVRGGALAVPQGAVAADEADAEAVSGFQARWDRFAQRLRATVRAAPKPIVAIGASHIQLNFLNFTGLGGEVDLLIDDDPVKAGRYAPLARAVPIRSTADALARVTRGTVLRTAFPYPEWEERICRALAERGVGAIAPYALEGRVT